MFSEPEPAESLAVPRAADSPSPSRRRRRAPGVPSAVWAGVGALLTGTAGAALIAYDARGLIGAGVASAWLQAQGVRSTLRIERLDASGFTGAVRLGDAANPDFASDHVELEFTPTLGLRAARIVAPRLRARFDGRRLTFGALQPMVDRALAGKPSGGPGPDINVQRGLALIGTPVGLVRVVVDGRLAQGRLVTLDARLLPARLAGRDGAVEISDGRLSARGVPGGLTGRLSVAAARAGFGSATMTGGALETDIDAAATGLIPTSPMRLTGYATAAELVAEGLRLSRPALRWRLHGGATGPLDRLSLSGDGAVTFAAARSAQGRQVDATSLSLTLASDAFHFARTGSRAQLDGPLRIVGKADRLGAGTASLTGAKLRGQLRALRAGLTGASVSIDAAGELETSAMQARLGGTVLNAASVQIRGRARASTSEPLRLDGGLSLAGDAPRDQARRWSAGVPLFSTQLSRALAHVTVSAPSASVLRDRSGDFTFANAAPVRVRGAGGAALTLSARGRSPLLHFKAGGPASGAFDLALDGGGLPRVRLAASRYTLGQDRGGLAGRLETTIQVSGDSGSARGARLDASAVIERQAGATVARLNRCAPLAIARYGTTASDVAAEICPASEPLLRAEGERWRVAADVRQARALLEPASVSLAGAAMITADSSGRMLGGAADFARLEARDRATKRRFEPLAASGPIRLSNAGWRGDLKLALADGQPLGRVLVTAAADVSAGAVGLDSGTLTFAQKGFQPSAISPLAPPWLSKVDGPARFTGRVAWQGRAIDTDGRLETTGLDATGPLGRVTRARGALQFTSLLPLTTAPEQTLQADAVAWIAPLSDVSVRFQLLAEAVHLEAAEATVSTGRVSLDPLTVALKPGAKLAGVLRLSGVDVGALLARSTLSDKLSLKARLSGAVPFETGPEGVRFTNGRLAADGPGRLSLNRKALTAGAVQTPVGQDLAYQALEDLAFTALDATVNSQDKGRLGVLFHINGRHDPPRFKEARVGLFDLLAGRALQKPVDLPSGTPVNLTLDTSLNFDELLAAYRQADQRGSEPVQDRSAK